ncbi:GDP-mannose 4,6-dehydratase [Candidatus Micrarchaeota archaeon]|nr:GDP-mannose 4,6-dehydratase [Candidatus Micrarchaeota archaeon]
MAKNQVLVTGGAGFIGSFVVEQLVRRGKDVVVLDNFRSGKRGNLSAVANQVKIVEGDIRSLDTLDRVMRGIQTVYHMAVEPLTIGLIDPFLMDSVNSTGTLNVLYAAKKHKVVRFNYVSSSEVYGTAKHVPMDEGHPLDPYTTYAASKAAGEAYTRAYHNCYGMDYTLIRPFNAFGPRHRMDSYSAVIFRFLERFLADKPPIVYGTGEQTRDLSFVKDSARGIVLAGESPATINDAINIGTGTEVSVNEIARVMGKVMGKDFAPRYEKERPGDVMRHLADVSKAKKVLGFKPEHTFEQGIRETVAWYKNAHENHRPISVGEKKT